MPEQRVYPERPDKIYFYGTCIIDLLYPEAGLAGMQLIQREGVEVLFPQNQTCCGQPAWNSGYRAAARDVARIQLRCFNKPYPLVVPSASCAGMLRHQYPRLFSGQPEQASIGAFSERVFELTEFLVHVLKIELKDLGEPLRVVLHNSCSARREMGVSDDHVSLLRQLEHVELVEPDRKTECCGFGGTFSIKHPEISAAMVEDKANAIGKTKAGLLVTGDCGCLMNIKGFMDHNGIGIPAQHIASLLWERTNATD